MSNAETSLLRPATSYLAIVGQILVRQRHERGLQQADIATQMDLSQSAWSRIERGEAAMTLDQLRRAAALLGSSGAQILTAADQVIAGLEQKGVVVAPGRAIQQEVPGLVLIGAMALGALIASAIAR